MTHRVLIGVGSNLDREYHTRCGLAALQVLFDDVRVSPVYECEAIGFHGPAFLNWVALINTSIDVVDLQQCLKNIEYDHGRRQWEKVCGSRKLDLDILTYDDKVCTAPIVLPRTEILYNAFVLKPMADLVPNDIHPVTGLCYKELWQQFSQTKQALRLSDFKWSSPQA
jgi:2-amino-4-hydroxy-6-hydroxymethyldihydropteridine diphosphokinase